jgi:hypothetical protein
MKVFEENIKENELKIEYNLYNNDYKNMTFRCVPSYDASAQWVS